MIPDSIAIEIKEENTESVQTKKQEGFKFGNHLRDSRNDFDGSEIRERNESGESLTFKPPCNLEYQI